MDDYGVQSERIRQVVSQLCKNCTVTFDSNEAPRRLRFYIKSGSTLLTKVHPEYQVSEVAAWPDEELEQMIETLTGGLVGKSA